MERLALARKPLAVLFAVVITPLTLPAGAGAVTKTVTFDDPSTPANTRVSNQYEPSTGVKFFGDAGTRPLVKSVGARAHSGDRVGVYSCEGLPGCGEVFVTPVIRGDLSESVNSVSAFVGYFDYGGDPDTIRVRIRAFNYSTGLVAESPYVTATKGGAFTEQVTATSPSGRTIDYFEVTADDLALPDDSGKSIAIDDLAVTTNDAEPPPPPNFTLSRSQEVVDVKSRTAVSVPIDINRINGSDGDISFAASGLPSGMSASFDPNPVPGTGKQTILTLRAANTAVPSDVYSQITVTATPLSAGAGASPRSTTMQVRIRPGSCSGETPVITDGLRVCSPIELYDVLASAYTGRVIVPRGVSWKMHFPCGRYFDELGRCASVPMAMAVRSNVELVGERGPRGSRPLLYTDHKGGGIYFDQTGTRFDMPGHRALFEIDGNNVTVKGLHIRGPNAGLREAADLPYQTKGILVYECPSVTDASAFVEGSTCWYLTRYESSPQPRGSGIRITDNEFNEWAQAVELQGPGTDRPCDDYGEAPTRPRIPRSRARTVHVDRNYIHHNARDSAGYGVVIGGGAYVTIEGNVFDFNRHDTAADCERFNGYIAHFNYFLQGGFRYGPSRYWGTHMDAHGAGTPESRENGHYDGGGAGEYYEITHNTILGEQDYGSLTRPAFGLRGRPERRSLFAANVVAHDDREEAVRLKNGEDDSLDPDKAATFNLTVRNIDYDADYSREIATGDFDGDALTDVFVANGTAWFYSSGGFGPWTFLTAADKRTGSLGFADMNNDRITDVLWRNSKGTVYVSDSATARFVQKASSPVPMSELRFGDFDGDGLTDMFYTDAGQWWVWYGKTKAWTHTQDSSKPISQLLFGEFDDTPGTDVVGINASGWAYSSGATKGWSRMNGKLSRSFTSAVAADFSGNGKSDIAIDQGDRWSYSRDGRSPLTGLLRRQSYKPLKKAVIGMFHGPSRGTEALTFSGNRFVYWKAGACCFRELSPQNMR